MPDLTNPGVQAKVCAGCHVGAAPTKDTPLRDVNHELIAAGHPRLNFEFGAFQANIPAHWRPRQKPEGHEWTVGQIVSAQAALELLEHRARSGRWPEFAEYDCFACHHALAPATRGIASSGRKPGTLPWGSWYFALTENIAGESPELRTLKATMQRPYPQRDQALVQAQAALANLRKSQLHRIRGHEVGDDRVLDRKRLQQLLQNGPLRTDPTWDAAEQTYLALHALNQSLGDPVVAKVLDELTPRRAFRAGFASPLSWPHNGTQPFELADFLERLQRIR